MANLDVSVVIPTHNRPDMVVRAVRSALKQSVKNVEVIVVDDASTDDTRGALNQVTDDRLRYERLDDNVGQGAARNRGLELARGDWVAFLDDDDEWLPRHLEGLLWLAERKDGARVLYRPYLVAAWGRVCRRKIQLPEGDVFTSLVSGWAPSLTSGLVVHRDVCEDGYDEELVGIEDYDFWLRLATRAGFAAHPAPLVIVDKTPRPDRTNLGVTRRLRAIDLLEHKWSEEIQRRGRGNDFAATCNQLRLATHLNAGHVDSPGERWSLLREALYSPSVSLSTRLSGALRLFLGTAPTNALHLAWFWIVGEQRDAVVSRAAAVPPGIQDDPRLR